MSTIHNYPFDDYPMKYGKLIGTALAVANIAAFRGIEYPVGCSETISRMVSKHNVKSQAIQNGVDTEIFYPIGEKEKETLKEKLNLPADKKVIISIGSLIYRKNPEMIIKSFLNSKVKDKFILIFLGNGKLRANCEMLVSENDNVKILGHVENVQEYLKSADYFISASRSEGLPNTVLEALATNVPVILSNIDQHTEILNFNKNAGYVFDLDSELSLTSVLDSLDQVNKNVRGNSCLEIINNHLNAKNMSEKYQIMYKQVVNNS